MNDSHPGRKPVRLAAAIPGWKAHDDEAAISALVSAGVLRLLQAGGKGRGKAARYCLIEPLVSDVSFAVGLHRLKGDAAALMLLVFLVDRWDAASNAPISAEGMSQLVGGPFGGWTKVKIVKVRDHLAAAGLVERLEMKRISARQPRAMFQMRAASVLKIPGNVPVDIHPPQVGRLSPSLQSGTQSSPQTWSERSEIDPNPACDLPNPSAAPRKRGLKKFDFRRQPPGPRNPNHGRLFTLGGHAKSWLTNFGDRP